MQNTESEKWNLEWDSQVLTGKLHLFQNFSTRRLTVSTLMVLLSVRENDDYSTLQHYC